MLTKKQWQEEQQERIAARKNTIRRLRATLKKATTKSDKVAAENFIFGEKLLLDKSRAQTYNEYVCVQLFELLEPLFNDGEDDKVKKICRRIISLLS